MKIVFMGTPQFAVESLRALHKSHHSIVGIVTVPDKKQGRGLKVKPSPVKEFAMQNNITPILQPTDLKDETFIRDLKQLEADVYVVVAFKILPEKVFAIPEKGTINLHASILPYYRGAAPINWVIMNGEQETGVTTFLIEKGVDTGKILLQKRIPVDENETAGSLHDKLAALGASLLVETLDKLEAGKLQPVSQPEGNFPKAPKITKDILVIDWKQPAEKIKLHIHGLSPFPGARTSFRGKTVKILKVKPVENCIPEDHMTPGTIIKVTKDLLTVVCGDLSCLNVLELQFEGKRAMPVDEAIRGYRFRVGEKFET
jgi:methionyl-tRNA formyltransferase